MDYLGENLLPGRLGNFFTWLSLAASLVATVAYFISTQHQTRDKTSYWLRVARIAFVTEVLAVSATLFLLLFILGNHCFEYSYAWKHSSVSLEKKYLFAALWEGQEGSFLLWSFWHSMIGLVLIRYARRWEAPVMTIVSAAQFCLATMIAGITVFGARIGSNPFILLRHEMKDPVFSQINYLSFITDGSDLNPLLQNYWMVIHPPVLFLGFAACVVPFGYAMAALWTRQYKEWVRPVLPWLLFATAALGTGIVMGAMWAYESLSFGGYWSWDPVENASLVPWLLLVAAIHTLVVFKHTGHSLKACFILILLSFLLVLYSTYLTRSGILGDTSVHAFTASGMSLQVLLFVLIFSLPAVVLYFKRSGELPVLSKEENPSSREWWMFMGSLILALSAGSILYMTSVPVFNQVARLFTGNDPAIFKPLAPGDDSLYSYNRIQVVVVILLALLAGFSQFLNYRKTRFTLIMKRSMLLFFVSVLLGLLMIGEADLRYAEKGRGFQFAIWLAFICAIFTVLANVFYLFRKGIRNLRLTGSVLSHAGFGLLIAGILLSSAGKQVLSLNHSNMPSSLRENGREKPGENLTLFKDVRTAMGDHWVTYQGDSVHPEKPLWYYKIRFDRKDGMESFALTPTAFVNYKNNEGLLSNPASRHYWSHDIFAYITSLPDPSVENDSSGLITRIFKKGVSENYSGYSITLEDTETKTDLPLPGEASSDTVSIATIRVTDSLNRIYKIKTAVIGRGENKLHIGDTLHSAGMVLHLNRFVPGGADISIKTIAVPLSFITLKVYKFPFIVLLWLGATILLTGVFVSMVSRIKDGFKAGKEIS